MAGIPGAQSVSDWKEGETTDGRRYYYNKLTKRSTWTKPETLMTPIERADASTVWKEYTAPEGGRKYFFNSETKQATWDIPDDVKLAREKVEKDHEERQKRQIVAKEEFIKMLGEITSSSTWEECKPRVEASSEYRAIGDENICKELFEEYAARILEKAKEKEHKQEEGKMKTQKEKEEKDKEREREKEKDKGKEGPTKDEADDESLEIMDDKEDKERRGSKRPHTANDDASSDKEEKEDSKRSRRHESVQKKARKHGNSPIR